MSEYFRVLKRLERDRVEQGVRRVRLAVAGGRRSQPPLSPERQEPAPSTLAMPADAVAAFATLFDNIRACTASNPIHTLVFAGVSPGDPAGAVISGLRAQGERHGLTVSTGKISHWGTGRAVRRTQPFDAPESTDKNATAVTLESVASTGPTDGTSWAQDVERTADLVLIEGPPLAQSIDAALLARASDGLVIVARTGVTARGALTSVAERVKAVGCRTVGVVLQGAPDITPRWLRRVMSRVRQPLPA